MTIDFGYGLCLNKIETHDLSKMVQVRNIRSVNQWSRQKGLISLDQQMVWYEELNRDPRRLFYTIKHQPSDFTHIGICGLSQIDHFNQTAEFSILINPEWQRKGHGKSALKTLLQHAFDDLNMWLVYGDCMKGNDAIKLFVDVGMTVDGMRPGLYFKKGIRVDSMLISMTRERFFCVKENWHD